jgi:hypothetical protein
MDDPPDDNYAAWNLRGLLGRLFRKCLVCPYALLGGHGLVYLPDNSALFCYA